MCVIVCVCKGEIPGAFLTHLHVLFWPALLTAEINVVRFIRYSISILFFVSTVHTTENILKRFNEVEK